MAKKKATSASEEGSESGEVYTVEVITKARVVEADTDDDDEELHGGISSKKRKKKRKRKERPAMWEYYVKWDGYDSDANTWEPEANLTQCERLLKSFWEHVGMDNEDYHIGYVVEAKEEWIKEEKRYFAKQLAKNKFRKEKRKEEKKQKKLATKQKVPSYSKRLEDRSTTSEYSKPIEIDSDSEDDQPLRIVIPPSHKRRRLSTIVRSDEGSDQDATSLGKTDGKTAAAGQEGRPLSPSSLFSGSASSVPSSPEIPLSSGSPSQPPAPPNPRLPIRTLRIPERKASSSASKLKVLFPTLKTPGVPSETSGPSRGISTKQRLAQGALEPTLARALPPAMSKAKPPMISTPSNPLSKLSFKKTMPTTSVAVVPDKSKDPQISKPQSPAHSQQGPPESSNWALQEPVMATSPMLSGGFNAEEHSATENYSMPSIPERQASDTVHYTATNASPAIDDADIWLRDNLPAPLAAPLRPSIDKYEGPPPPSSLYRKELDRRSKMSSRWTWSGSLANYSTKDIASDICYVSLHDATDCKGMALSHVLSRVEKLEFSSFHNASDMNVFLSACKYPTQFALLDTQEDKGAENAANFSTIVRYMSKHSKVLLIPARLDGEIVSHILLFPHTLETLWRLFHIPVEISAQGKLIAAHVPWALTPNLIQADPYKPPSILWRDIEPKNLDGIVLGELVRKKPLFCHALRMLRMPKELYDFLFVTGRDRAYCIWNDGVQGSKKGRDPETKLLQALLRECPGAKDVGQKSDTRLVFIHVGALRTLHKLPGLTERRSRVLSLQFYTYGTHPTVSPEIWGIKEIYPCGGIVTFTPNVILHNPVVVRKQIQRLKKHDLWLCYILPSALGMAAKLVCGEEDPLASYDSGKFALKFILEAIEEGSLALLQSPPAPFSWSETKTVDSTQWFAKYMSFFSPKARKALEVGLESFNAEFSNFPQEEWRSRIETDISQDLSSMLLQPVFMRDYRRYVVFTSQGERPIVPEGGLEWVSPLDFDFKDDFFSKPRLK